MSVPTDQQTFSMHRYLQSQGFRCSVGTPLNTHEKVNMTTTWETWMLFLFDLIYSDIKI